MSFEIRVNGEAVYTTDDHVIAASMNSAKGELAKTGISLDDSILDIRLEVATGGGNLRLDHVEALQREQRRELRKGDIAGNVRQGDTKLLGTQGDHTETATPPAFSLAEQ